MTFVRRQTIANSPPSPRDSSDVFSVVTFARRQAIPHPHRHMILRICHWCDVSFERNSTSGELTLLDTIKGEGRAVSLDTDAQDRHLYASIR